MQQVSVGTDDIEDASVENVKRSEERVLTLESSKRPKISDVSVVSSVSSELSLPSLTGGEEVSRRIVNLETATVANSCRNGVGNISMNGYDFERIASGRIPAAETAVPSRITLRMQTVSSQSESCQNAFIDELEVCISLAIQFILVLLLCSHFCSTVNIELVSFDWDPIILVDFAVVSSLFLV
jgi:hypothetical protein